MRFIVGWVKSIALIETCHHIDLLVLHESRGTSVGAKSGSRWLERCIFGLLVLGGHKVLINVRTHGVVVVACPSSTWVHHFVVSSAVLGLHVAKARGGLVRSAELGWSTCRYVGVGVARILQA